MSKNNTTNKVKSQMVLGTTKDTTKAIETRAGVLQDAQPTMEIYLQYGGKECSTKAIAQKVRDIWTKDMGRTAESMKTVSIYLKPEENMAYYVINEETTGKIEL